MIKVNLIKLGEWSLVMSRNKSTIILIVFILLTLKIFSESKIPNGLINYSLNNQSLNNHHLILVEKSKQKAYLYQCLNDSLIFLKDFTITSGKKPGDKERYGDLKTPEGFYTIEGQIPRQRLSSKYGIGAFPLSYPNAIDRYLNKNGNGIWLHGTDKDIVPLDTEGCIRFNNKDLESISPLFEFGKTPVIIADSIEWYSKDELNNEKEEFIDTFLSWREAWESQNIESYFQYYHQNFYTRNLRMNFEQWIKYKEKINNKRSEIKVTIEDLHYFYSKNYLLTEFKQTYHSKTYSDKGTKTMLWKREPAGWVILREEWDGFTIPILSDTPVDFDKQIPESNDLLNMSVKQNGEIK